MTDAAHQPDELAQLAAALCDDRLEPHDAARLETLVGQSDAARRFFVEYIQLHGELHWDRAASARPTAAPRSRAWHAALPRWAAVAVAASLLVAVGWWIIAGGQRPLAETAHVAQLARTFDADWIRGDGPSSAGEEFAAGQKLALRSGLAEIHMAAGARLIVEGPAELTLESRDRVAMPTGTLAAHVPAGAKGFSVATPSATVVDRGTEFGVAVADGLSEVHVFAGAVELQPGTGQAGPLPARLGAGEAVELLAAHASAPPEAQRAAADPRRFIRTLPAIGSGAVAQLRRAVAGHPALLHHYTFEGGSAPERLRDQCGNLHLAEVAMGEGRGGGELAAGIRGLDGTTRCVAPFRPVREGNSRGVGLRSVGVFQPPAEMTVEALLRFEPGDCSPGSVFGAVGVRPNRRQCGLLLAAADDGQLAHLLDAEAAWTEPEADALMTPFVFHPGQWYYVVGTFRVADGETQINTYAANLTQRERSLRRLVRNQTAPGVAAAGRLYIGSALDADLAPAYPWAGEIDEVAVYRSVLDEATLQSHLAAVIGGNEPKRNTTHTP